MAPSEKRRRPVYTEETEARGGRRPREQHGRGRWARRPCAAPGPASEQVPCLAPGRGHLILRPCDRPGWRCSEVTGFTPSGVHTTLQPPPCLSSWWRVNRPPHSQPPRDKPCGPRYRGENGGSRPYGFKGRRAGPAPVLAPPPQRPRLCTARPPSCSHVPCSGNLGGGGHISNPRTGNLPLLSHKTSCSYHHFHPERGFAMRAPRRIQIAFLNLWLQ